MATRKPSYVAIAFERRWHRYLGLLCHQHLERQAGERTRRHNNKMLVLDQILDLAEQRLIQLMRLAKVERQRLRLVGQFAQPQQLPAPRRLRRRPPFLLVKTAAER